MTLWSKNDGVTYQVPFTAAYKLAADQGSRSMI